MALINQYLSFISCPFHSSEYTWFSFSVTTEKIVFSTPVGTSHKKCIFQNALPLFSHEINLVSQALLYWIKINSPNKNVLLKIFLNNKSSFASKGVKLFYIPDLIRLYWHSNLDTRNADFPICTSDFAWRSKIIRKRFSFKYPINCDTFTFGGILTNRWIWSGTPLLPRFLLFFQIIQLTQDSFYVFFCFIDRFYFATIFGSKYHVLLAFPSCV